MFETLINIFRIPELRNKVLREWTAQGGVDMSWLYGEQP